MPHSSAFTHTLVIRNALNRLQLDAGGLLVCVTVCFFLFCVKRIAIPFSFIRFCEMLIHRHVRLWRYRCGAKWGTVSTVNAVLRTVFTSISRTAMLFWLEFRWCFDVKINYVLFVLLLTFFQWHFRFMFLHYFFFFHLTRTFQIGVEIFELLAIYRQNSINATNFCRSEQNLCIQMSEYCDAQCIGCWPSNLYHV